MIRHHLGQSLVVSFERFPAQYLAHFFPQILTQAALTVALGNGQEVVAQLHLAPCERCHVIAPLRAQGPVFCQVLQGGLVHKDRLGDAGVAEELEVRPDDGRSHAAPHHCHQLKVKRCQEIPQVCSQACHVVAPGGSFRVTMESKVQGIHSASAAQHLCIAFEIVPRSTPAVDQHNDRPSLAESVICQFDPISGGDELSLSHVTKAAGGLRCVMPPPKTLSLVQRSV
mmetsp:Transcript_7263/g.21434  ORF Transcript_7263/g.21434 Transcript_7263/m.21434 type:complete len:227 (+) Transcript_7263:634-1314(+)